VKIAAWNVNSLNVRLAQVADWLQSFAPDVLCLQETKLEDHRFPVAELEDLGYEAAFIGQKTYNGVAILSRRGMTDVQTEITDLNAPDQRRVIAATINGVRVVNVYVVNGQALDSDKFVLKMQWLDALHRYLQAELQRYPELVLLGDFNIAPADLDIYDAKAWGPGIHASIAERDKLAQLMQLPLFDSFRLLHTNRKAFSWWDYRAAAFRRDRGLRIDLALISDALRGTLVAADIDKQPRSAEQASDHTPIWLELKR
jgi:exodeoxyribonuclease III